MNILIVDDVPHVVELIRETLVRAGLAGPASDEVRAVHSAQEARWELLRHRPELLVLDEVLPGESPMDLLQDPAFSDIPVLFVSATAATARMPSISAPGRVLGRVPKWGWNEVDRVAGEIRRMVLKFP
jgi:CheY-like chemotaxis protein